MMVTTGMNTERITFSHIEFEALVCNQIGQHRSLRFSTNYLLFDIFCCCCCAGVCRPPMTLYAFSFSISHPREILDWDAIYDFSLKNENSSKCNLDDHSHFQLENFSQPLPIVMMLCTHFQIKLNIRVCAFAQFKCWLLLPFPLSTAIIIYIYEFS